jgi:hypothetical protein
VAHIQTPAALQDAVNGVRTATAMSRVIPCNVPRALVVRGTADQVDSAGKLIAELDH